MIEETLKTSCSDGKVPQDKNVLLAKTPAMRMITFF